jgi:hypothetical protein
MLEQTFFSEIDKMSAFSARQGSEPHLRSLYDRVFTLIPCSSPQSCPPTFLDCRFVGIDLRMNDAI